MFEKLLARAGFKGFINSTTGATAGRYAGCVPTLGANNKLDPSVVDAASIGSVIVNAQDVVFDDTTDLNTETNVRDAIQNIIKAGDDGLAMKRASNLADAASVTACFDNIKHHADISNGTNVYGGVVGIATQAEIEAGTTSRVDNSSANSAAYNTPLVVPASLAKDIFVNKTVATAQTIVSQIVVPAAPSPANDNQLVTKAYVQSQISSSISIGLHKTLWVDPASTGTGQTGVLNHPFQTLTDAKNAAVSGDLIYVLPGTYNENNIHKNGVSWYFMPGAKVVYSGSDVNAIFQVGASEKLNVDGMGHFECTNTGSSGDRSVLSTGSGAEIHFKALYTASTLHPIVFNSPTLTNVSSSIEIFGDLSSSGGSAAKLIAGNITMTVHGSIYSDGSTGSKGLIVGGGGVYPWNGLMQVKARNITGKYNAVCFDGASQAKVLANIISSDSGSAVLANNGGTGLTVGSFSNVVQADSIYTTSSTNAIVVTHAKLHIMGGEVWCENSAVSPIFLSCDPEATYKPFLILNNCGIWTGSADTTAIAVSNGGIFTTRIVGYAQSNRAQPGGILWRGGVWDTITSGY